MADQTGELFQFIWRKHPGLDPEAIGQCIDAITEWLDLQGASDANHG